MNRIDRLIGEMTLAEKLGQLTMTASSYTVTGPVIAGDSTEAIRAGTIGNLLNMVGPGPVHEMQRLAVEESRLGIPLLIGLDIIHGHSTLFPIPLAEAAVFDPLIWEQTAREAAREGAADGLAMTFAPMLDVSRDPRWGRTAEGSGEDPLVATLMARAKVLGFQGSDLAAADSLAACAKHFCAYSPVTAGREYASVDISERTLREVHLPAFAAAVAAGVVSVMPAFTDLAGLPMTCHAGLLRHLLREQWGFDGVIVSDYNAIAELLRHGVAADLPDAAARALAAGVDIDMMSDGYRRGLPVALERGTATLAQIDTAVRRVLQLKERLGLFDDPYRRGARPEDPATIARRRQLARSVATRAITLLKNARDTLPLAPAVRQLAVIGPLADASAEMRGTWWAAGQEEGNSTVVAGLRAALPLAQVGYAAGVRIEDAATGADLAGVPGALALCQSADAIVLCLGEAAVMSGEAASRADPGLSEGQKALALAAAQIAQARQVPLIAILFSGRPLIVPWLAERVDALVAAWALGCEAGNALADVLTGRVSPGGRTPISWPRTVGQVPIFHAQRPSGRPADPKDKFTSKYLDVANEPLYPFGHGLTYGRFVLSGLQATPARARRDTTIRIAVTVRNAGQRAAEETVFVFIRDLVASVARPLLELKGFGKIALQPGAQGRFTYELPVAALEFLGPDLAPVYEPGEVEILVGPCADRSQLLAAIVTLE